MSDDLEVVITRYLDGTATDKETSLLDARLQKDSELRQRFVAQASLLGLLAEALRGGAIAPPLSSSIPHRHAHRPRSATRPWPRRATLLFAAIVVVGVLTATIAYQARHSASAQARVLAWHGSPTLRRHEQMLSLATGQILQIGDRIDTGADNSLELSWLDGSHTTINAASQASVTQPSELTLERGQIDVDVAVHVAPPSFAIVVGVWRVEHIGTAYSVSTTDGPQVRVREGSVSVRHPHTEPVTVTAGRMAVANATGEPLLKSIPRVIAFGTATQPFSATSLWNIPLPRTVLRTPVPAASLATTRWVTSIKRIAVVTGDHRSIDVVAKDKRSQLGRIPGAAELTPTRLNGVDFLIVYDPDGRHVWELQGAAVDGEHMIANKMLSLDVAGDGTVGILPSGFPACAGMIREHELETGIDHTLAVYLNQATLTAIGLQIGDRLALPEDFVAAKSASSESALIEALRRYGAVIVGTASLTQISADSRLPNDMHERIMRTMNVVAQHLRHVPSVTR